MKDAATAIHEMGAEPQRQRLSEELMWQLYALPPLSIEALARLDEPAREEELGSRLYNLVRHVEPSLATKVVGMLLELDTCELLEMVAPPLAAAGVDAVCSWVDEAKRVLELNEDSAPPTKAPPPSPAVEDEVWHTVERRRRRPRKSSERVAAGFSMEELELKLHPMAEGFSEC